jgi:beta-galactosidase
MSLLCADLNVPRLLRILLGLLLVLTAEAAVTTKKPGRTRTSINSSWRFFRSETNPDGLIYDQRPDLGTFNLTAQILKPWILPAANAFMKDPSTHYIRPAGNPGSNVSFVQNGFDDSSWEMVNLPHDWAIKGPFYQGDPVVIGGNMGRLPVHGVGWYRRRLSVTSMDINSENSVFLDFDGAMSYAIVWLNGHLVGGWPYGYNSFRLDLTPYLKAGEDNLLAVRLDNPIDSARWYSGGGIYRNVWITKVNKIHVGQSGTFITTPKVSTEEAMVEMIVEIENNGNSSRVIEVVTDVHVFNSATGQAGAKMAEFPRLEVTTKGGQKLSVNGSLSIYKPRLWMPSSEPGIESNLYVGVTRLYSNGAVIDTYETRFGIRSIVYDPDLGLSVNGVRVAIQGTNNHHDLGALGAAFNIRAAERHLEILQQMGCNSIRMSHNPPAPELLDLTDRMGFLVLDEIFDVWYILKTTADFHLIFPDWYEADLRSFIRRDRNHPSVFAWSYGNEVGEQYTDTAGAEVNAMLHSIVSDEDPSRQSTNAMNYAKPYMPFPVQQDIISLNYQGNGIRDTNAYSQLSGIRTNPLYSDFHVMFPEKMIMSSESSSALSTRGSFIFPVTNETSAPVNDTSGGDSVRMEVSAYELYTANFGSSPDKVFASLDQNTFAAGEFVWTGWDYLGEPTPYYTARSSYSGIIDLAGFPKDRYFLYQSRWRPDLKMAHILPHWTWPDRVGLITPVHVFSSADEAELFVNGKSQGKIKKKDFTYRFRWDQVVYQPGRLVVNAYKNGSLWTTASVQTAGTATQLGLKADRNIIKGDGNDLCFVTVAVNDEKGNIIPYANNIVTFSIQGPGELAATDNGFPADFVPFPSAARSVYNGLALAVIRAKEGASGTIIITATSAGLGATHLELKVTL